MVGEPFHPSKTKRLILAILSGGKLSFSSHAYDEMEKDDLVETDIVNTLRGGAAQPGELVSGTYRYQFRTSRIVAVITFRSETWAVIVTAWRLDKK